MLSAYLYHSGRNTFSSLDADGLLSCMPTGEEIARKKQEIANGAFSKALPQCRSGELLWVDITAPTEADYALLMKRFDLHHLVVEDIQAVEGRPKLHDYGEYLYIIFHALLPNSHAATSQATGTAQPSEAPPREAQTRFSIDVTEVDCLVGPDYVVTVHMEAVKPFDDLRKRWQRSPEMMRNGSAHLLYELMDEVLDDYFPLLDALDESIDAFEQRLFSGFQQGLSTDIFSLKRCLLEMRRIAAPTRDVVNTLLRHDAESGGRHFAYFQDLYDHAVRIVDTIDTFRDILAGALDAYLATESNRMNNVMKTLTASSILLLVPNLVAAIYGMNFDNMPELKVPSAYYFTLAIMANLMLLIGAAFRRKGWF